MFVQTFNPNAPSALTDLQTKYTGFTYYLKDYQNMVLGAGYDTLITKTQQLIDYLTTLSYPSNLSNEIQKCLRVLKVLSSILQYNKERANQADYDTRIVEELQKLNLITYDNLDAILQQVNTSLSQSPALTGISLTAIQNILDVKTSDELGLESLINSTQTPKPTLTTDDLLDGYEDTYNTTGQYSLEMANAIYNGPNLGNQYQTDLMNTAIDNSQYSQANQLGINIVAIQTSFHQLQNSGAELNGTIIATLADYMGELWVVSSPKFGKTYFKELYNEADSSDLWKRWRFTTYDNPHISRSEVSL